MFSQSYGNSAFSGGGFMPSQATQNTDFGVSPAKNREALSLLPITVKQIADAIDSSSDKSSFVVDGVAVNNVTLVGMVLNKTEKVTDITFTLDDGTGRLECHRWLNEEIDSKEMAEIQDGSYVRVHGNLKGFQGKKQFAAFSVRPVTDFNEISYHFIECIYIHVCNTKSQKGQSQITGNIQPNMTNSAIGTNISTGNQFVPQYGVDGGVKSLDQKVLDYLSQPSTMNRDKGAHTDELVQQFKVPLAKIMEAIRVLEADGNVYSTYDEFHYKSAMMG